VVNRIFLPYGSSRLLVTLVGPMVDRGVTLVGPMVDRGVTLVGPMVDRSVTLVGPMVDHVFLASSTSSTLLHL